MAKLNEEQQRFVVIELACFRRPTEIIDELKERFNVDATRSQISHYDPTNRQGHDLSPELQQLFWAKRAVCLEDLANIGISHQTVRLQMLDDLLDHQFVKMSPSLKLTILEQAAKEMGGLYVQKRQGATEEEVNDYVQQRMEMVRKVLESELSKPEANRVLDIIKDRLEEDSK